MNDTAGFCKVDEGQLLYAKERVTTPDGIVTVAEKRDESKVNIEKLPEWRYFSSEQEARQAYGLPEPQVVVCPECGHEWDLSSEEDDDGVHVRI